MRGRDGADDLGNEEFSAVPPVETCVNKNFDNKEKST